MLLIWSSFIAFVLIMLALDLGVFHKKDHVIGFKEALGWSGFWISLGLLFSVFVYFAYQNQWGGIGSGVDIVDGKTNSGMAAVGKYLTGYIVEKSLSMDNIFVMAMIFAFFKVPALYQHRVLFWGIMGALIMRGAMIGMGAALIQNFSWILYVFAVFLIVTAVKMLLFKGEDESPSENIVVKWTRRFFPVTADYHGHYFIVHAGSAHSKEAAIPGAQLSPDPILEAAKPGTLFLTPLAVVLVMVETTDLIFAVDSIPAVFAITADPFLVFTSNVFAILGLRSLYFALAGMMTQFRYLKPALAIVLLVVGVKMLFAHGLHKLLGESFNLVLLLLVLGILVAGVVASIVADRKEGKKAGEEHKTH